VSNASSRRFSVSYEGMLQMAEKKQNPVTLQCDCGACQMAAVAFVKTPVVVEVREAGAESVDLASAQVTLTSLKTKKKLNPDSRSKGPHGELVATFKAVPQGRYRVLAVRAVAGKPESSAARNVLIVKKKGQGAPEAQLIVLTMAKQGVAKFVFVNDVDDAPLGSTNVIIRHPDGLEQRHTTDSSGEVRLAGSPGDVFSLVRIEHPTNRNVTATETQETT